MQSNVDIKAKATFRAMSGLTSGGLIVASHDNPVTDATLDGITVDGGYSQYGSALSGVLWSEATRLKFVNGQIVNCGGMGLSMHHGSTNCKFVLSDINGAGLSDGLGGAGVNISGSTGCLVALSTFLNCVCFGILGQRSALTARIIGNYLDKTNNPTVAASGAWSGGDLETLTSPITAGFPQQGSVVVPGFGSVTYTGLDPGGAGFTGCTPSSGTVANGAPILSGFENIGFQWTCADWVVQGNQSIGSRDNGISADGPEAVVTGNLVDTCQYDGIFSLSAGTTITGNTIRNPGSVGAHLGYSGVNLNATSGNIVNGNQAVDTRGGSACMEYGFRETGAGSLNQFGINSSVGHTNSPYSLVPGTTSFVQVTGTTGQTDASTITPNATAGLQEAITVTDGSAFTIQDPDYPFPGATMTIVLVNASGGTMGTITWGAAYTFVNDSGSLAGPPNGAISTITFYYNGTSWIETARSTATIPASSA
jgi:putative cofactor-binding repeat protein